MFRSVAGFELRHQIRQPLFWVTAGIFFLLTFGATTVDQISIGGLGPSDHRNSPFAIVQTHLVLSIFYMFVTAAFVANVIIRDDETGYGPIIRSTRISKFDYLYGRFAGAFAAACLSFLAVPLAIMIGALMPWIDPEKIGPFNFAWYAFAFGVVALPSLFLTSAIFFFAATVTRSLTWTYIAVIALMTAWITTTIVFDRPEYEQIAAYVEPFGAAAFGLAAKYWTVADRNSLLPPLAGALAINRLGVAFAALLALGAAWLFFDLRASKAPKMGGRTKEADAEIAPPPLAMKTLAPSEDGLRAQWARFVARTRLDMAQVFGSPAYLVLLAIGLANAGGGLWFAAEDGRYGGVVYPVTRVLLPVLEGAFGIIPVIIAIFYAGELVWRERDKHTHEIIDSTPTPDWAFLAPKTAAIVLVLISTLLVSVLAAVLVQLGQGYQRFEFDKYLLWYVLPNALDWSLLAVLAVFLQAISPHKFVGWGLMVIYIVCDLTFRNLGWEDRLYSYGSGPPVPLSDMNRLGDFWVGAWWFRLYWSAFAAILLVLAYALWRRGTETRLVPRLARLPHRLAGAAGLIAVGAGTLFVVCGVFIYINTHVWNTYRTTQDGERWQADFEKALLPFEATPQPKITAVTLDIDLHPHAPKLTTCGTYRIENRSNEPLREVHVLFDRDTKVLGLSIQGARPKKSYPKFNYRIFTFDTPMQPGEVRTLSFTSEISQRGFTNGRGETGVVDNGTFVDSSRFAPLLGVTRSGLLQDRSKRRKYGLPPELHMPPLGDQASLQFNYLRHDSDWVKSDITLTTDADQTPIAPGDQVSDVVKNGRRTARFVSDAPILNFFSVQSARYAVKRDMHKGVQLSVFYDPQHAWNIDRMIAAQKATLDYATTNFGPYPYRQLRFIEFPDYARFAQAFAGAVPWSEGLFFIANYKDPKKIDMVTYVGAHEIGHQWWAHQLLSADQQGATALSETLAQYTAIMVMKRLYGPDQVRKFLKFELDSYLRDRGGSVIAERPLNQVEAEQGYIHYRKGSLVMYRLADEIGEEQVNIALRAMLAKYGGKGAPYPNANDLIAAYRAVAPADKQDLITDLFERICLYDLKTTDVKVTPRKDGRFDVALTVEAKKLYADGKGVEREAPMNETVELGLFLKGPDDKAFGKSDVVAMEKRQIRTGRQVLTFTVAKRPSFGGVDPYNILIDRNGDDNVKKAG